MSVRRVHPADRQLPRFPDPQRPRGPSCRAPAGTATHRACVGIWKAGILKTSRPARPGAAQVGPPGRASRGASRVPQRGPLPGSCGACMGAPMGRSGGAPRATLGRRRVGRRGATAWGPDSALINSPIRDQLMGRRSLAHKCCVRDRAHLRQGPSLSADG